MIFLIGVARITPYLVDFLKYCLSQEQTDNMPSLAESYMKDTSILQPVLDTLTGSVEQRLLLCFSTLKQRNDQTGDECEKQ